MVLGPIPGCRSLRELQNGSIGTSGGLDHQEHCPWVARRFLFFAHGLPGNPSKWPNLAPGARFSRFGGFPGQKKPVRKNEHKLLDGLPEDTALDGSGLQRSRCHRFEALGEIYDLAWLPGPEKVKTEENHRKLKMFRFSAEHFGTIGAREYGKIL